MENENFPKQYAEVARVKELLGSLERVAAPDDFTFKVRARIAERKAGGGERVRGWSPAFLRIAAPAALTVAVAAGGFYALMGDDAGPLPKAEVEERMELAPPTSSEVADAGPPAGSDVGEPSIDVNNDSVAKPAPAALQTSKAPESRPPSAADRGEGSTVLAAKPPAAPLLPRGIDPQTVLPGTGPGEGSGEHRISEILQMIGVQAERERMGWTVLRTTSAGVGGRAGIRQGDIVVAIDGRSITDTDTLRGSATIRTLQVIRDGRRVTISLASR